MTVTDTPVFPSRIQMVLEDLATCLCAQIVTDGLPPTCFCGVLPGQEIALDYADGCGDGEPCGMAWVRLETMYPSTVLASPAIAPGNCAVPLGLEIEVGIVRCIPGLDESGTPPDAATLLAVSELQYADAQAMWRAIACCHGSKDWVVGAYGPYGPVGGVVGGVLTVALQVF